MGGLDEHIYIYIYIGKPSMIVKFLEFFYIEKGKKREVLISVVRSIRNNCA